MSKFLPANRVAAIVAFLTGLGTAIAQLEGAFPSWQTALTGSVAVLGAIASALHFMTGSQKYDALVAHSAEIRAAQGPSPVTHEARVAGAHVSGEEVIPDD